MSNLIINTGDEFFQCDNCGGLHHVIATLAGTITPECPEMSGCSGGPVTEITEEQAEELL